MPELNQSRRKEHDSSRPGSARVGSVVALVALATAFVACLPAMLHLVVTSDGVNYLATANNLLHGNGFTTGLSRPATTWMPLYPVLLAGVMALVGSRTAAAVMVNFLAVASIFVVTWLLVRRWRGKVDRLTWFAAAATALSPVVFSLATFALSETLFAALVLLLIYAATRAETDSRWIWCVAVAGVAVALTRHVGVFALVAIGVAWRKPRYWLALLPGTAATALWVVLAGTGDQLSGFSVSRGFDGIGLSFFGAATQLGGWPMLGLVILALVFSRKLEEVPKQTLLAAMTLLLLTALGGFFYVAGDLDGRMQVGAHVLLVPCLLTATSAMSTDRLVRWAIYAGFAAFILYGVPSVFDPNTFHARGVSFNSPAWRSRRSLELVRHVPADVDIYTNAQDGVWFATGRMTYELPRADGRATKPHADRGGLVVYFKGMARSGYVPPEFYNDRVLRDSTGKLQVENNAEALIMRVSKAQ